MTTIASSHIYSISSVFLNIEKVTLTSFRRETHVQHIIRGQGQFLGCLASPW